MHTQVPLGSIHSYQLSPNEGNFQVYTNFPNLKRPLTVDNIFPQLPHSHVPLSMYAGPHNPDRCSFLQKLEVDDPSEIEQKTIGQSTNPTWFSMRKNRLTSSNFGVVCKRKKGKSHEHFVRATLLNQSDISNVPSVKYGIENEAKAADIYENTMACIRNEVKVMQCGTVISPKMPWLSASPDRKVIDSVYGPRHSGSKMPIQSQKSHTRGSMS
jgi:hypothetical protein